MLSVACFVATGKSLVGSVQYKIQLVLSCHVYYFFFMFEMGEEKRATQIDSQNHRTSQAGGDP